MTQAILPQIIGAIGAEDFAAVTAGALCEYLGFELTAVIIHRRHGTPAVLFDNFAVAQASRGIENYIRFTHKINPMLARTYSAGVHRARDFALDPRDAHDEQIAPHLVVTADEELGFRTVGWPPRQEEICLYLDACAGLVELGFYRKRGRSAASPDKLRALETLSAPIAAAFDRHASLVAFPESTLSPREREVCDLLLLGCSSAAIASRLDISPYTVKDHRKQIFRKLRVGSLAELFALRSRRH
jgi:DNA-binding CsgD family transcriptional regulator